VDAAWPLKSSIAFIIFITGPLAVIRGRQRPIFVGIPGRPFSSMTETRLADRLFEVAHGRKPGDDGTRFEPYGRCHDAARIALFDLWDEHHMAVHYEQRTVVPPEKALDIFQEVDGFAYSTMSQEYACAGEGIGTSTYREMLKDAQTAAHRAVAWRTARRSRRRRSGSSRGWNRRNSHGRSPSPSRC
jgi:hypothetical protein